ncbi:uncharacterized protein LOC122626417 [Drosophila teissieri]|uniref:uncharacterized protein LOC122626417 n=1 Tax=Drosophila teissieri TaxID=7243 RepID=UPI001CB9DFCD|nr:uncharacterized protein LOC122626417 [Drosophila teissieri]XP_043662607.1 uncharacterized protein LOC122626417 [Drosophila teissieri]XP_043662608.1 uncharacterized protein LOC122626417 [Drosophila teissieri]
MGNVMDRKVSCSEARATNTTPTPIVTEKEQETLKPVGVVEPQEIVPNLSFHLFSYRQQMGCKKHQLMKWATSKLVLTEELLKLQRQPVGETNESWTDFASLYSDEDDEENRAPTADDPLAQELSHLKNYRMELRGTILEFAQEKMKKREKKKLKRLKRRTLISSKKPSNKNKLKYWHPHPEVEEQEQVDLDAQDHTDIIVID